ncbi:hypothetical protein SASPL_143373 [Salvia splendens]|uniref:Uncharacterized protein n=1 Tax=Salvia splendens TaxID=180675 RepID=A0A8X8WLQ8_SALSN|nr:hypothetical protein SASPL_143373 [Salvia splendens]
MSTESSKALAEIAAAIKKMRWPPQSAEAHVQSAKSAADRLRSVLQYSSLPPKLDLQEVASLLVAASVLIDVIRCADGIAAAVGELEREVGFEGLKTTEAAINRHGIVSPVDDGDHVVVEIQAAAD